MKWQHRAAFYQAWKIQKNWWTNDRDIKNESWRLEDKKKNENIRKCSRTIVRSEAKHLNENCVNLKTHKRIWHGQVNDIIISNNRFFVLLIANKWVILFYNCPTPVLELIFKAKRLESSFKLKAFKLYFLDLLCISQMSCLQFYNTYPKHFA